MNMEKQGPDRSYNDYLYKKDRGQTTGTSDLKTLFFNGDSISSGYAVSLRENLQGKLNAMHRKDMADLFPHIGPNVPGGGEASTAVSFLEAYIDDEQFKVDFIMQNSGIHEVIKGIPPKEYIHQLETFIKLVHDHGIYMIWVNSTPMADELKSKDSTWLGSDIFIQKYNDIAADLMDKNNIPIIDFYTFMMDLKHSDGIDKVYRDWLHHTPETVEKQGRFLAESLLEIIKNKLYIR